MIADWPELRFDSWRDTQATLHRCLQIVGKIRLSRSPIICHWWNVALRVTARGVTTTPIPADFGSFTLEFDFVDHNLLVRTSRGETRGLALVPRPVATFYGELLSILESLGIDVHINERPVELPGEQAPFSLDLEHSEYDPDAAHRWWQILVLSAQVMEEFRAGFVGKASPVLFWWGGFDLATSRYSGRRAPPRPGADPVQREAYSHEVSSVGVWPGDEKLGEPMFYAYFVPAPKGYAQARVRPAAAFWHEELGEFLLPYEAVRTAADPRHLLLEYFESTYEIGAELAGWNREELERHPLPAALAEVASNPPTIH